MDAPWICPKCGRVWGPMIPHCAPCNKKVDERRDLTPIRNEELVFKPDTAANKALRRPGVPNMLEGRILNLKVPPKG